MYVYVYNLVIKSCPVGKEKCEEKKGSLNFKQQSTYFEFVLSKNLFSLRLNWVLCSFLFKLKILKSDLFCIILLAEENNNWF